MSSNKRRMYKDGDGLAKSSLKSRLYPQLCNFVWTQRHHQAGRTFALAPSFGIPSAVATYYPPTPLTDRLTKSILLKAIVDSRNVVSGIKRCDAF